MILSLIMPELSVPHLPTIALVGRTNVGKSTLFNRLTETSHAIVDREAGTTRDRTYGECVWRGRRVRLIDTGGMDGGKTPTALGAAILRQAQTAIREADAIALVVDGQAGLTPFDRQLARALTPMIHGVDPRWGNPKRVVVICNKIDRTADEARVAEFFRLGLGTPRPVSAKNGRGSGELLDAMLDLLPGDRDGEPAGSSLRIGLVGKPNVGKSSLVNQLVGSERVIVTPEPLTTRETQQTNLIYRECPLTIVDTAGIKPRMKISGRVAKMATRQSLQTLPTLDVAALVCDASVPISQQDRALASLIAEQSAGTLIVANKWDLVQPSPRLPAGGDVAAHFHAQLAALSGTPVLTVSARTGQNVTNILDWSLALKERRQTRIAPEELQRWLQSAVRAHRPTGIGRGTPGQPGSRPPRLISLEQSGINPPRFTLLLPPRQSLSPTYQRFLAHRLVRSFDLQGANVKLHVQQLRATHRRARQSGP